MILLTASAAVNGQVLASRFRLDVSYEKCTMPRGVDCVAGTKKAKDKCSACTKWVTVNAKRDVDVTLPSSYTYDVSEGEVPRSQEFVADMTKALYGVDYPREKDGTLVRLQELAADPERYGWMRISSEHHTGVITLNEAGRAGVTVGKVAIRGAINEPPFHLASYQSQRAITDSVIHVSDSNGGDLGTSLSTNLFRDSTPIMAVPAAPAKTEFKAREKLSPLSWNPWITADHGAPFDETDQILPDSAYELHLDLSAFSYRAWPVGSASDTLRGTIADLLGDTTEPRELTAVVIADDQFVHLQDDQNVQSFALDLKKIDDWYAGDLKRPQVPMRTLKDNHGKAPFRFAAMHPVRLRTTSRSGRGSVAISLWLNDRPIDEVVLDLCIGKVTTCAGRVNTSGLNVSALRPAARHDRDGPFAALELINFGPGKHVGAVMRLKGSKDPFWWHYDEDHQQLADLLTSVSGPLASATTDDLLRRNGAKLLETLIPDTREAKGARQAFKDLVNGRTRGDGTLYVRMLRNGSTLPPLLIPLGFMFTGRYFVGDRFRVEQPLAMQEYSSQPACIEHWYVPRPEKEDQDLTDAAKALVKLRTWHNTPANMDAYVGFQGWMDTEESGDNAALFLLGHYGVKQRMGVFAIGQGAELSENALRRRFSSGSIAVLNACGTAASGGEQFVYKLNTACNMQAIVATAANVTPQMARDYYDCFETALENGGGSGTIGELHDRAIHCLRLRHDDAGHEYGSRALTYLLLGDPKLCIKTVTAVTKDTNNRNTP
jgi:hypothetical protein